LHRKDDFLQRWQITRDGCAKATVFAFTVLLAAQASNVTYHIETTQPLSRFRPDQRSLLQKLNRVDAAHLAAWNRLIVPGRWDLEELAYSPLPAFIDRFSEEPKTVVVHLPAQVFGAYELGTLVRWGPVSSGGPGRSTPAGRYQLNWHARVRISSVDDSWVMPWYFNFDDSEGYGFHQYSLPGRPASHGCVRLLERDAKWLFYWGQPGTPVTVCGRYDFSRPRPWMQPAWWSRGVTFPEPVSPTGEGGAEAGEQFHPEFTVYR
jgi:lipoprotein-anchoring transpeptidase ErfK/SrfK